MTSMNQFWQRRYTGKGSIFFLINKNSRSLRVGCHLDKSGERKASKLEENHKSKNKHHEGNSEMIDLFKVEVYLKSNGKWCWVSSPRRESVEALKARLSTQKPLKILELTEVRGFCTEERLEVSNRGWFEKSRKLEG